MVEKSKSEILELVEKDLLNNGLDISTCRLSIICNLCRSALVYFYGNKLTCANQPCEWPTAFHYIDAHTDNEMFSKINNSCKYHFSEYHESKQF